MVNRDCHTFNLRCGYGWTLHFKNEPTTNREPLKYHLDEGWNNDKYVEKIIVLYDFYDYIFTYMHCSVLDSEE